MKRSSTLADRATCRRALSPRSTTLESPIADATRIGQDCSSIVGQYLEPLVSLTFDDFRHVPEPPDEIVYDYDPHSRTTRIGLYGQDQLLRGEIIGWVALDSATICWTRDLSFIRAFAARGAEHPLWVHFWTHHAQAGRVVLRHCLD